MQFIHSPFILTMKLLLEDAYICLDIFLNLDDASVKSSLITDTRTVFSYFTELLTDHSSTVTTTEIFLTGCDLELKSCQY